MEILQVFGIKWQLLAVQMLNFAVLIYVLNRFAYKPIMRIISERQEVIVRGVKDSEEATALKGAAESEKERILLNARQEAERMVIEIKKTAEGGAHDTIRDAQEKAVALVMEAKKKAEEVRAQMIKESEKEIAKLVVLGMERSFRAGTRS